MGYSIFLQCKRDFKHKTESETHAHPGGRRNLGEWSTEQVARQIQLRKRRYRYRCSYRYGYRARLMDFTRRSRASEMMAILAHTLSSDIASLCGSLISQIGHSITTGQTLSTTIFWKKGQNNEANVTMLCKRSKLPAGLARFKRLSHLA